MDYRSTFRKQRGAVAAEAAVIAPVFALLLVGIGELGNAFYQYNTLNKAVRDGARYLAGEARVGTAGVIDLNSTDAEGNTISTAAQFLVVYGDADGSGTPVLNGFNTSQVSVTVTGADHIDVSANYPYQSIFGTSIPTFGFGPSPSSQFNLQASSVMRALN